MILASRPSSSLLAPAVLLTALVSFGLFYRSGAVSDDSLDSLSDGDSDSPDSDDGAPLLTLSETVEIFSELFLQTQNVVAKLSQQIAQIQSAGQNIPDAQVRQIMTNEFERSGNLLQAQIFGRFEVEEEDVREAVAFYADDKKLTATIARFKSLYEGVTGKSSGPPVEIPEGFSPADLVRAAETYFAAMTAAMVEVVEGFKEKGVTDFRNPANSQKIHTKFAEVVNEAGEAALDNIGVPMGVFKAALEKFAALPQVASTLQMQQMKQAQTMMALGVPMM
uniref:Uncharacterized protein n=1 Tax=Corethron hystrix TaxID=216773 RepID=A0A6U5MKY3_9STRA|eukprot:CAMPEP_0113306644 /NCGR_PEP_ID=MMETSP0010_2-20120614/5815_1 /TAXON_ID=216773 ORGANISM="Corethron hystrix, Strain 308" /NCGR_SAMPLE_ID=MMETSP0010_2 /ASSEMBLY_ACC=CAM_ASM_000155 /LENGTH=278 /DNA_ID=CAMNT_0000161357 /DNA_START=18 /DNA_END=854 /DNA_ORIENTATION=+ /assembly_acc=CAM_ASM_000155